MISQRYNLLIIIFIVYLNIIKIDSAFCSQYAPKDSSTASDIELENMIIDETMTKIGKDFYDYFYINWTEPYGISQYQITISERILPGIGSQIFVMVNDLICYQSFVKPRDEEIEQAAKSAILSATRILLNYEIIKADLEGRELKGTGIY